MTGYTPLPSPPTGVDGDTYTSLINANFAALVSKSASATAPSSPTTWQDWVDTTTNPAVWNVFDGATWVEVCRINTSTHEILPAVRAPSAITGTSSLVAVDRGKYFNATSGTFVLTLTAAATVGAGWWAGFRNSGAGVVTVTPASGTIDGAASVTVKTGSGFLIVSDGTNFFTIGRSFNTPATATEVLTGTDNSDPLTSLSASVLWMTGTDIASASTLSIPSTGGDDFKVTGTTGVTAISAMPAGFEITLRFTGVLNITHNATSLFLPGAATITTAANDVAKFISLGSGNWYCSGYNRASGLAVVATVVANPFSSHAGSYSMLPGDNNGVINFSAAGTFSLLAAATAGNGFSCGVWNSGSGTVTIDPSGAETINSSGSALGTIVLRGGDRGWIYCDGSKWVWMGVRSYDSGDISIAAAGGLGTLTVNAHGLGVKPHLVQMYLVCRTSDQSYNVGDEVLWPMSTNQASASRGVAIISDASNVSILWGNGNSGIVIDVLSRTNGTIQNATATSWRAILRAKVFN